jgi:hypothetical protein
VKHEPLLGAKDSSFRRIGHRRTRTIQSFAPKGAHRFLTNITTAFSRGYDLSPLPRLGNFSIKSTPAAISSLNMLPAGMNVPAV